MIQKRRRSWTSRVDVPVYVSMLLVTLSCIATRSVAQDSCENGDVRLTGGVTQFEGRVELCWNSVWRTVCDDSLLNASMADLRGFSSVLCRELGFRADQNSLVVTSRSTPNTTELFGRITNPVSEPLLLNQVMCNGSEGGIIECIGGISVIPSNCSLTNNEDIGVRCSPRCTEGSIRLADGGSYNSGRVELCYNESWSTVADVTPDTANVICRQLGFSDTGTQILSGGLAGPGVGEIYSFYCQGDEMKLSDCTASQNSSFSHSSDTAVTCRRCVDQLGSVTSTPSTTTCADESKIVPVETCSDNGALGALLGISLVALLGVTIGWIVTCFKLKKMSQKGDYSVKDEDRVIYNKSTGAKPVERYENVNDFTSQPTEKDTEGEEPEPTKPALDTASLDSYVDMSSVTIRKDNREQATVLDNNYSLVREKPASDTASPDLYVDVNSVTVRNENRGSTILQPENNYSIVDAENFGQPVSCTSKEADNPLYDSVAKSETTEEEAMYVNVVR